MGTQQAAELFISFVREYAPINRQANMYHEEIEERAVRMGVKPLKFDHPALSRISEYFSPKAGQITNLILTGTAGDGKTRLLYDFWSELKGDNAKLADLPCHIAHNATVADQALKFHFIFDLSKCLPEKGQQWNSEQIGLLEALVVSLLGKSEKIFIVAANDGKLLQALRSLREINPSADVSLAENQIEEMLAQKKTTSPQLKLALIDLSGINSAEIFDRAYKALMTRPEWACFSECHSDPAFGPNSPLRRNWQILSQDQFFNRLRSLIELCDVNGFHISVRDIIAMLVNGLLGHPKAVEGVLTMNEMRSFASPGESLRGGIHRNIFGENLVEDRRQDFLVFSYLNYFRVGYETSNAIDELILFGHELPHLKPIYQRLMVDPLGQDMINPTFEALRRDYLEAEDFDDVKREDFLKELIQQRRRLFFRLSNVEKPTFDPWHLTVFQYAGRFLEAILHPLKQGAAPDAATLEILVRGLNRVWSGMLFDEGNKLFLTSGLDFTSARISRLVLHTVPVCESLSGEKIDISLNHRDQPELQVHLLGGAPVCYRLDLMRFEFLVRVAEGALPNSFSRECYEDVINFKSLLLARVQAAMAKKEVRNFKYLSADPNGRPAEETINL